MGYVIKVMSDKILTNEANITVGASFSGNLTNMVQSGSCTNNQTNVFASVFSTDPIVIATWAGTMASGVLYIKSVTPSNCVIGSSVTTNTPINWIAK